MPRPGGESLRLERRVAGFVAERRMLLAGESALLLLSGGADSMALLHLLMLVGARLGLGLRLAALHVDYGTRGADSERDRGIVVEACASRGVPLSVVRLEGSLRGAGFQERARELRYRLARDLAAANGHDVVVTAHNRDDQAETILYRLAKYASPRSLAGMRPRDGDVARPLLCLGAAEIRDYCAERGVAYGEDVTNLQACYARNVIRLDVLPPLRRINPRVTETLAATADLAAAEAAVLADATAAALCRSWRNDDEAAGALDVQALLAEPPALRALVLHEWLRAAVGGALVERRVVDGVQKLTTARREGGRVSLRDGLEAVRGGGRLRLRRPRPHACDDVELAGGHLAAEAASGVVVWFCGRAIRVWLRPGAHRGADAACGSLGLAGPPGTVSLHHPRRAERFAPSGLGAETTVARFLAAARVPPDLRAMSLVVGLDGTVAWVGFPEADGRLRGRVADHARVDESTKWTLHISEEER